MRSVFLLQVLCLTLAASERTLTSVTTSSQNTNVSISFVPAGGKGSAPLPLNDSRIAPTGGAEQVNEPPFGDDGQLRSWSRLSQIKLHITGPMMALKIFQARDFVVLFSVEFPKRIVREYRSMPKCAFRSQSQTCKPICLTEQC
jgi:hypothetical protein